MKRANLIVLILGAAAGVWWALERNATELLRVQLEIARHEQAEHMRLLRENARLRQRQPAEGELERLRQEAEARRIAVTSPAGVARKEPATGVHALKTGTWAAASELRNSGRATPEAAVETTLWAAAGGELAALRNAFEFDPASRIKVEAILASLPESARRQYGTPEELLALFVARDVPLDQIQVVTRQRHDADTATVFVRLKSAEGDTQPVYLTLRRRDDGWKLIVPDAAVDNVVSELTGVQAPRP